MSAGTEMVLREARERRSQTSLEHALACAFWRAVNQEPMPVMAALEAAARAVGTLYRQAASAHGTGGRCGCGWEPDPDTDLIVLEAMLAAAARESLQCDLRKMPIAGRA